jgi:hypothetical protein
MTFEWDDADVARFMTHVDKLPCGCWFYTGARSRGKGNRKWYGTFYVKGRRIRAHRFSAVAIGGQRELEYGEHRDHTCVFSLCVNFDHLEIVTREVNEDRKKNRYLQSTEPVL